MVQKISMKWMRKFQNGNFHTTPIGNFSTPGFQPGRTLFESSISGKPIDLYIYNADTGDLLFGRANLSGGYSRELAHHIGLVHHFLKIPSKIAEEKFSQGSLDIAVDHIRKLVFFKHLTLGLQDHLFPQELEWVTHIGSLQDLAIKALQEIGMPLSFRKSVVKANEWARIRTGLMRGKYISYEAWKVKLQGGPK